jgi:Protein of unknown function (DUF3048) N-terminal domain/Protein of unknown function (DUF3048) C-terminal domain
MTRAGGALSGSRGRGVALLLLAGGLGLTGCTASAAPAVEPTTGASAEAPVVLSPLLGTPMREGEPELPSLAAKIDNHPLARPQYGLDRADIVFEELVEGGVTRYVAVWHSYLPPAVGPVRSIRPMDPDIVSPFGGIIAYSGGQDRFVRAMRATDLVNVVEGEEDTADVFWRSLERQAPHNALLNAARAVAGHHELDAPPLQFRYASPPDEPDAVASGDPATLLETTFSPSSTSSWTYDAVSGVYARSQNGVPDLAQSGTRLAAANVVVARVDIDESLGVPRTELEGSGEAWIATGGRVLRGTWVKEGARAPLRLVSSTGSVLTLAPGNTWVELVPNGTGGVRTAIS